MRALEMILKIEERTPIDVGMTKMT